MKAANGWVIGAAVLAGSLGVVASLWWSGHRLPQAATPVSAPSASVDAAAPGDPMPALELPDLQGKRWSLPDAYRGRPLLINVWASWCGPCIEEMPELERYARSQSDNGVQVIGLALDTPNNIREFLERVPVTYPILIDTPGPDDASVWLGNRKGVLPYSVLVGRDGKILKQKIGPFQVSEVEQWAEHKGIAE